MTRELLFRLINQQLLVQLFLIELSFILSWFIVIKLQLRIVEARVELKKILFCSLIGSIINLLIKPFLPALAAPLIQVTLLVLFLKVYGKVRLILAFWAFFLSLITIIFGSYIIPLLLYCWDKNTSSFLVNNEYGMILGTLGETIGPAIMLHILSTFKFSVTFPVSRKPTKTELLGIPAFGLMYLSIYNSCIRLLYTMRNNPKEILNVLLSDWITIIGSVLGASLIVAVLMKQRSIDRQQQEVVRRQLEIEQQHHEITRQQHETERRSFQAEIDGLQKQNKNLHALNERLKAEKLKPREMLASLQNLTSGLQDITQSILDKISPDPDPELLEQFSGEELKIIRLVAQGASNKQIGAALYLDDGTVANIITGIYKKTGTRSRAQLSAYATRENLTERTGND